MQKFTAKNLFLTDDSPRLPYERRGLKGDYGTVLHWGQRKLILSEIYFLTHYWNPQLHPHPLCVYAGAAKGTHITLLSHLFPDFEFHLYDPSPFSIEQTDRIRIFTGEKKGFFTNDVAATYKNKNVFFISDIRTADHRAIREHHEIKRNVESLQETDEHTREEILRCTWKENEDAIWKDMLVQQEWVMTMNPLHALLKFRLPWAVEHTDEMVGYLRGRVFLQGLGSVTLPPETRLIPLRNEAGEYEVVLLEYIAV